MVLTDSDAGRHRKVLVYNKIVHDVDLFWVYEHGIFLFNMRGVEVTDDGPFSIYF